MRFRSAPLLALVAFLAVAGCDTNNGGSALRDLAGTYVFTELRFDPSAPAIAEADVLSRLNETNTEVRLFTDGDVLFLLEFDDATSLRADGTADASRSTVRLSAITQSDVEKLSRLLIPSSTTFTRGVGDQTLSGTLAVRANMERYDPANYAGLVDVPGTLFVRLERR